MAAAQGGMEIDLDKLRLVMEAGLRVRQRHHFFSWAQGPVQTMLPHDVMICGVFDDHLRSYRVDFFSCYPLSAACMERMGNQQNGVLLQLVRAWSSNDHHPLLLDDLAASALGTNVAAYIVRYRLLNLLAHGICGPSGPTRTFFSFCRIPGKPDQQYLYMAELLVPILHAAWMRTLHGESPHKHDSPPLATDGRLLTVRESEILHWVHEGKSNMEIGVILGISGLTVKNHVQNILRKLKVQNRAQAVGKGLSLDLLRSHSRS